MKGKPWYSFLLVTAAAWLPQPAAGQLFNIDVDVSGIPPYLGGGVPSSSFGAAAGQPGFWNNLSWGREAPLSLRDITGAATSVMVSMRAVNSSSGGGYNFTGNTGDYALLLNDAAQVGNLEGGSRTYTFSGMLPGLYHVYTYAVAPDGAFRRSLVSVDGSSTPNPQVVTGPMPGNSFETGITHSIHDVSVTNGSLIVFVKGLGGSEENIGHVNGFQIVPEPSTGMALLLPCVWALARAGAVPGGLRKLYNRRRHRLSPPAKQGSQ